jgi:hypothetical protein
MRITRLITVILMGLLVTLEACSQPATLQTTPTCLDFIRHVSLLSFVFTICSLSMSQNHQLIALITASSFLLGKLLKRILGRVLC